MLGVFLIKFIEGTVSALSDESVVVEIGPIGIEIYVPEKLLIRLRVGDVLRLDTYLVVREDGWTLYGFSDSPALNMFKHLISVSGVGPKLGLAMLSTLEADVIGTAILHKDAGLLSSAPGIGKKTAERIVLELENKVAELPLTSDDRKARETANSQASVDAIEALVALGYRESNVRAVVSELAQSQPQESAEGLIRKGLGKLR